MQKLKQRLNKLPKVIQVLWSGFPQERVQDMQQRDSD